MQPVTPSEQVFVLLHPGYSTRRIATELKSAGVIRSADAVVLWQGVFVSALYVALWSALDVSVSVWIDLYYFGAHIVE